MKDHIVSFICWYQVRNSELYIPLRNIFPIENGNNTRLALPFSQVYINQNRGLDFIWTALDPRNSVLQHLKVISNWEEICIIYLARDLSKRGHIAFKNCTVYKGDRIESWPKITSRIVKNWTHFKGYGGELLMRWNTADKTDKLQQDGPWSQLSPICISLLPPINISVSQAGVAPGRIRRDSAGLSTWWA